MKSIKMSHLRNQILGFLFSDCRIGIKPWIFSDLFKTENIRNNTYFRVHTQYEYDRVKPGGAGSYLPLRVLRDYGLFIQYKHQICSTLSEYKSMGRFCILNFTQFSKNSLLMMKYFSVKDCKCTSSCENWNPAHDKGVVDFNSYMENKFFI